ncbi:hypothetical protein EDC04DRAFT_2604102 [Pisolithus marmoratus]|nr:hypothetical protein EDC04DRAFT_2604102 [Pisolithus marmoratus]
MCIQLAVSYKILSGQDEIMAHLVNMQNAVEMASSGIKGGFQLSADQAEWLKSHVDTLGFQNVSFMQSSKGSAVLLKTNCACCYLMFGMGQPIGRQPSVTGMLSPPTHNTNHSPVPKPFQCEQCESDEIRSMPGRPV